MERQNTNSALHDSVLLIARGRIDKPSEISQEAYKVFAPTLQEMRRNKDLHVSFAIDGLALALLKEESPELLDLLVELAKSKQAKLLLTAHSSPCALLLSSKQLSSQLEKNRLALK